MRDAPGQAPLDEVLSTDAHFVLDIAGTYRMSDTLCFYGKVDNATRAQYIVSHRPFGIRPGKPMRIFEKAR